MYAHTHRRALARARVSAKYFSVVYLFASDYLQMGGQVKGERCSLYFPLYGIMEGESYIAIRSLEKNSLCKRHGLEKVFVQDGEIYSKWIFPVDIRPVRSDNSLVDWIDIELDLPFSI